MTVVEKVGIFVYTLAMGASNRMLESGFNILVRPSVENFMKFWKSYVVGDEHTWVLHMTL
ncbi:hypothetical protein SESBI_38348 [Sesbania bispinosa]|nr:hypothetical protein SESBI_38348 [Sesbania bispinosa]